MKTFGHEIIAKMSEGFYPGLNAEFIVELSNESKRGAVLIGTARVEEYLKRLVEFILPHESKKDKYNLLEYPGVLSTLSSKIELLYAFRLIDFKIYSSLTVLRKLRNKAAHTTEQFDLQHINEKVNAINDFEEHFATIIEELALKNLLEFKEHQMRDSVYKLEGNAEMKEKIITEKLRSLSDHPAVKDQLVIWKLAYGMTFMCIKLLVLIDEYSALKEKKDTWLDIINSLLPSEPNVKPEES